MPDVITCTSELESPVPEIGTPGSESGGRKRVHGNRPAARLRKHRMCHRPPTGYAPPLDSTLLTSASLHDSQAAIPLASLSAERTTNLYDLMDAAYDAEQIREHSRSLGHVPLIDVNPRGDKARAEELRTEARRLKNLGFQRAEQVRYNERTAGERVNGRLKDEFGGRHVRVRGAAKVMCHCMFGMLALTADQLLRLVT